MRKLLVLIILMSCLTLAGCRNLTEITTYTKPYRFEGSPTEEMAKGGLMMTREFVAREVYYTLDPIFVGYPLYIRMVDANGLDLPNPVWDDPDPEYLRYEVDLQPNLRMFWAKKVGSTTISATQDGYTATARIEILPVGICDISPQDGVNFDGDFNIEEGKLNYDFVRDTNLTCKFPYGAYKLDMWGHPYYFSDIPDDIAAPETTGETIFTMPGVPDSPFFAICRASGGGIYAVWVQNNYDRSVVGYRKLR